MRLYQIIVATTFALATIGGCCGDGIKHTVSVRPIEMTLPTLPQLPTNGTTIVTPPPPATNPPPQIFMTPNGVKIETSRRAAPQPTRKLVTRR